MTSRERLQPQPRPGGPLLEGADDLGGIDQAALAEGPSAEEAAEQRRAGGSIMRNCTLSPKRSRRTVRMSPRPSMRPRSRASAPTQKAPEKRSPLASLSFVAAAARGRGRRRRRGSGAGGPSGAPRPPGSRAGTGRASPCSRRPCAPGARRRCARSADRSRSSPRRRRWSRRWRRDRRRSRRPRRRSCSRRRPPHPRRRR